MLSNTPLNGSFTFYFFWSFHLMQKTNNTIQATAIWHKAYN